MAGTTRAEYEREQTDPKKSANFWPKEKGDPNKVGDYFAKVGRL